jgi:16S rRNA processing protein RimM
VEVGRVLGAYGVKGAIKVKPLSSDPQALFSSRRWFVEPPAVRRDLPQPAAWPRLLRITQARRHGETIIATCQELADRDQALALAGARVMISRASFPTASDDEFYWVDLIGMTVRNRKQEELGRVVGLVETGPHSVLRIQGDDETAPETLVPFVAAYVDRVDMAGRTIDVDWDVGD